MKALLDLPALDLYHVQRVYFFSRSTVLFWIYIVTYGVFLLGGSVMIASLESGNELQLRSEMASVKNNFLRKHPRVNREWEKTLMLIGRSSWEGGLKFSVIARRGRGRSKLTQ